VVASALVLGACGGNGAAATGPTTVRVLAASSLTEAFSELERAYEADHHDVDVVLTFGGSSALATQVAEGVPADVVATADAETMDRVVAAGDASAPVVFARNRPALVVEAGNPLGLRALGDLARPGVVTVLCAPEVPCGRVAARAFQRAGVAVAPRSLEENVKGVIAKVALGEADAGIAYVTDARAAEGRVDGVAFPGADAPELTSAYPMAVLNDAAEPAAAKRWVAFVRSATGQRVLDDHGFLGP
jgi:molybdate transport system substrate-binding protein